MKVFYFTSTGNSLYVAKKLGGELFSIPQVLNGDVKSFEDGKIGIVFPCYFLGTPRILKEFLEKVELKSDYIFAIMTYGNYSAAGLDHFRKFSETTGIKLSYFKDLLMVDNYLPMFNIEDQLKKEIGKNTDANLAAITEDIRVSKINTPTSNALLKVVTSGLQLLYTRKNGRDDEKFIVENSCTACKICEKVCPVGNIQVQTRPEFSHHCDECLACVNLCPSKSIRIKNEKGTARFKNQHVTLKEIIDSNNTTVATDSTNH